MYFAPSVRCGVSEGEGGAGVTSLHKSNSYVPPQRLWFLCGVSKKERLRCEFEIDFKKTFRWRSNLSNDNITVLPLPGLKTGIDFKRQV